MRACDRSSDLHGGSSEGKYPALCFLRWHLLSGANLARVSDVVQSAQPPGHAQDQGEDSAGPRGNYLVLSEPPGQPPDDCTLQKNEIFMFLTSPSTHSYGLEGCSFQCACTGGPKLLTHVIRCRPPLPQPLRHMA